MLLPKQENLVFPKILESTPYVYYSKILGPFYREKLKRAFDFLPKEKKAKVLEMGFGSGVALKELASRFEQVVAVDIHDCFEPVKAMLVKEDIRNVTLMKHDIFSQPFPANQEFDCVLSSSVFEHIPEARLKQGMKNVHSILKDNGLLILGFPVKSVWMNSLFGYYTATYKRFYKGVYRFSLEDDHPSGEAEIVSALEKYFDILGARNFLNRYFKLYMVLKCAKRKAQ